MQRLMSRQELIPNSRHKAVLYLCRENELLVFVATHEQCIEHVSGNVTAYDEFLLDVRADLDLRAPIARQVHEAGDSLSAFLREIVTR